MKHTSLLFSVLLLLLFVSTGCDDDCPEEALIGPGFLQETIDDYYLSSDQDTLTFVEQSGEVKEFYRLHPEAKSMTIKSDYLSVACNENEDKQISLSSEMERIDNLFATDAGDTISIALKILNSSSFRTFDPGAIDLTESPVYLEIQIFLAEASKTVRISYIAYWNSRNNEPPAEWINLRDFNLTTANDMVIGTVFIMRDNEGDIYYSKARGLLGFKFNGHSDWRLHL